MKSTNPVTCANCQETNLFWTWNFTDKKSILIDKNNHWHQCPSPQQQDIFSGWCDKCHAPDLLWLRKQNGFELTESHGLPHACEQDQDSLITEITATRCKCCNEQKLLWVCAQGRFSLRHFDGSKHECEEYKAFSKDWAEAKRMNYAMEKAWLKSIPDGSVCKKCKGLAHTVFISKNKRTMKKYGSTVPVSVVKPCHHCKRLGIFSPGNKKWYLKQLRKKYWPFRYGFHKWTPRHLRFEL